MKEALEKFAFRLLKYISDYSIEYVGRDVVLKSPKMDSESRINCHYRYTKGSTLSVVLSQLGVTDIIDVGANTGQFAKFIRDAGYEGRIYSFEPNSAAYETLSKKAGEDSRWRTFRLALGEKRGETELNVTSGNKFSSLYTANEYASRLFGDWVREERTEKVPIRRIDKVLCDIPNEGNVFLKMDTQGHDIKVFRGASNLLGQIICLQSELAWEPLYKGIPLWKESIKEYEKQGFQLAGLWPVSKDPETQGLIEADGLFVRGDEKL
jgi:FkbM family methyltransferase